MLVTVLGSRPLIQTLHRQLAFLHSRLQTTYNPFVTIQNMISRDICPGEPRIPVCCQIGSEEVAFLHCSEQIRHVQK